MMEKQGACEKLIVDGCPRMENTDFHPGAVCIPLLILLQPFASILLFQYGHLLNCYPV